MAAEAEEKVLDKSLEDKGLNPKEIYIVKARPPTYVPSDDMRLIEIFQFFSSILLLFGGVFLGVVITPNQPLFAEYSASAIVLILAGIGVFAIGIIKQRRKWDKQKVRSRVS